MKRIKKEFLSKINLYTEGWTQHENSDRKSIKSTKYNSNKILGCPFYKPISKLISLNENE